MDETELRELIPPKEENPLLKKKPLDLGTRFMRLRSTEETVESVSILKDNPVTLMLFAAQWCNISKQFLGVLQRHYEEINLQSKRLEVIYVSLDKSKKDYDAFTKCMPWLGIAFGDERIAALKEFYDVRSIPTLILLDSRGECIYHCCREDVYVLQEDEAYDKWLHLKEGKEK